MLVDHWDGQEVISAGAAWPCQDRSSQCQSMVWANIAGTGQPFSVLGELISLVGWGFDYNCRGEVEIYLGLSLQGGIHWLTTAGPWIIGAGLEAVTTCLELFLSLLEAGAYIARVGQRLLLPGCGEVEAIIAGTG